MELSLPQWGQIITLLMISVALGMDAFSLGIGVGMKGVVRRQVFLISGSVGVLHVLMPLLGYGMGRVLGFYLERIAVMVGGGLLCFLGLNMIYSAFRDGQSGGGINISSIWGIGLFSFSVSLDSLSAGLSLGFFDADGWLAVTLFGVMGTLMGAAGLLLGQHVGSRIGDYGEAVGGIILFFLGLRFLM